MEQYRSRLALMMIAAMVAAVSTTSTLRFVSDCEVLGAGLTLVLGFDDGLGAGEGPIAGTGTGASTKATGFE